MAEKAKEEFKDKYINQIVRVTTKNKRVFEGKLKAIDFKANLVIYETVAYIPPQQNCPLNRTLSNGLDSKLKIPIQQSMTEEQKKKVQEEYTSCHYYIGGTIISGHDIVKVQMKFPPLQKQQKKVEKQGKVEENAGKEQDTKTQVKQ